MSDTVYNTKITAVVYPPPTGDVYGMGSPTSGGVDISALVANFSYYESIFSPFCYAELTLMDSTGLLEGGPDAQNGLGECGLRKFSCVDISLPDPMAFNKENVERSVEAYQWQGTNCFYVNKISNQLNKGKKKIYTLKLVPRDSFTSIAKQFIQHWGSNGTVSSVEYNRVIEDILNDQMQVQKTLNVTGDRTEPTGAYSMHNVYPLSAIKDILKKSVSLNQSGSVSGASTGSSSGGTTNTSKEPTDNMNKKVGYAFFETYDNFTFRSLESFVNRNHTAGAAPDPDEYHSFAVLPVNDRDVTAQQASQSIISYKHFDDENTTDVLTEVRKKKRGTPKTVRYDVTTNTFKTIEQTGTETDPCNITQIDGSFQQIERDVYTEFQVAYLKICRESDLNGMPVNPKKYEPYYDGGVEEIKERTSTIRVPGNLTLKAGDRIFISVPKTQAENGQPSDVSDKYSGLFSIISVAHRLENINKLYTDLDICKFRD